MAMSSNKKMKLANLIRPMVKEVLKESRYVILGIAPGETKERLLVRQSISDLKTAEILKQSFETKYGCKNVRIRTATDSDDFSTATKNPFK